MNFFTGLSNLWRFPIIGEETWAGVCLRKIFSHTDTSINQTLESSHVTSSQLCPFSSSG